MCVGNVHHALEKNEEPKRAKRSISLSLSAEARRVSWMSEPRNESDYVQQTLAAIVNL